MRWRRGSSKEKMDPEEGDDYERTPSHPFQYSSSHNAIEGKEETHIGLAQPHSGVLLSRLFYAR